MIDPIIAPNLRISAGLLEELSISLAKNGEEFSGVAYALSWAAILVKRSAIEIACLERTQS